MADLEFDNLASIGVVKDIPAYQLPPEAWTVGTNMRVDNDGMSRMSGWEQVFGTPEVAPHFTMPLSTSVQTFWLYTSLTKAYVYDGSVHTEITRVSGDYTATETYQWNGTVIGGVPILNNGVDLPQYWSTPSIAQKLQDLANWDATWRTKFMRSFGAYLIAGNITKSGVNYPHMVKWSHPVDNPGTVPTSWDETDPATDAGEYELADVNSGVLLDALPLGPKLYLYKEGSVQAMRYIGGRFVFQFEPFLDTVGLLAPRCVCILGDGLRQVFVTQDDILVHNGNKPESILDQRRKREIFSDIDTVNFVNSFVLCNPAKNEVGFYYPRNGEIQPSVGLIWNYQKNALTDVDGITFRGGDIGRIESVDEETWADGTDTWADETGPWAEVQRRKLVVVSPASTKFFKLDSGVTRDGMGFTATLQREGLSIIGKKRDGSPIVDHQIMKFIRKMWPKVQGGPIRTRVGYQMVVNGPITWGPYQTFDPSSMMFTNHSELGRAMAVEFSSADSVDWRIDGYKLELETRGRF